MSGKRRTERQAKQPDGSNASSPATSQGGAGASHSRRSSLSPGELVNPQIDFQFLNFSHPSEAKTGKTRKVVRSHVTKQQHQRENAAAAARRVKSLPTAAAQDIEERHFLPLRPNTLRISTSSQESPLQSGSAAGSPEASPSVSGNASPLHYSLLIQLDPTEIYPQEWRPYIARMLEHYLSNLAVDTPDLDGPDATGLLRTSFFPFIMSDPAPIHAVMLLAASHYERFRGSRSHAIDLLQLRGMAIHEINNALEDPVRALSDQMIAAVAKMASYEALFGDRSTFNTHMTGLLRMVSLRGGLPALGLDGLLERVLLWIDVNASHITGAHLYFDKAAFPTSAVHPRPDPSRFSGGLV